MSIRSSWNLARRRMIPGVHFNQRITTKLIDTKTRQHPFSGYEVLMKRVSSDSTRILRVLASECRLVLSRCPDLCKPWKRNGFGKSRPRRGVICRSPPPLGCATGNRRSPNRRVVQGHYKPLCQSFEGATRVRQIVGQFNTDE
jgi:hypothetical protein